MSKKVQTQIDLWTDKDIGVKYKGRLLGLITDKEFNAIINSARLQKKVATKETVPLKEITDNHKDLDGYRLVLAIRSKDDITSVGKKLFISERLHLVSYVRASKGECGITGETNSYLFIKEGV
jgi:hypothetical protein